ncbi:DsrE family protein [Thiocystis violacea]|uniref:DsrE family protein n=1 Tax=Thiocystis violacea TaxID=13725 RepID=UPI00190471CE|nr:DsrE family protein [Thiocystis violacea]MBK1722046.1 hypothetical protein [Thiocystis violacea]
MAPIQHRGLAAVSLLLLLLMTALAASAEQFRRPWGEPVWEPPHPRGQSIAITLKTDPTQDHEAACVALQIGMNLLMTAVTVDRAQVDVEPARDVTLFPTLAGVELVNPANDFGTEEYQCATQDGPTPLRDILANYVWMGGRVVVCGLCAIDRGITEPTYGAIGTAQQVHEMFLYADKVITY